MSIFNTNRFSKNNNKLSLFVNKHKISYKAYELLKKLIIAKRVDQSKLDFAHPEMWKPKVLKNLSPKAIKTLYRLSDNKKDDNGLIAQSYIEKVKKSPLSPVAKTLLKKIKKNEPRYSNIDVLIKKYKINKILD